MLSSADPGERAAGARDIYRAGRELADAASQQWQNDPEFAALLAGFDANAPQCNVGLAVNPITFEAVRDANASPHLAEWRATWPQLGITDRQLVRYEITDPVAM